MRGTSARPPNLPVQLLPGGTSLLVPILQPLKFPDMLPNVKEFSFEPGPEHEERQRELALPGNHRAAISKAQSIGLPGVSLTMRRSMTLHSWMRL